MYYQTIQFLTDTLLRFQGDRSHFHETDVFQCPYESPMKQTNA